MAEAWTRVGDRVIVRNPITGDVWRGSAIAYVDSPSFLIEQSNGFRLVLPAGWVEGDPEPDDSEES